MSKSLIKWGSITAVAVALVAGALYFTHSQETALPSFTHGQADSTLFLPVSPSKIKSIHRHTDAEQNPFDDVVMTDGTTKIYVYDKQMTLRQATSFYKAPTGQEHGSVMYQKTHDQSGHLSAEQHFTTDGALQMDGLQNADLTYTRHLYYPGKVPSADPAQLVVSSEQTFDKWWHPVSAVDFRPDHTRSQVHTWGDGQDENFDSYALDGQTLLTHVQTGRGKYYTAIYYPDGQNIRVEALNNYEGTTYQWYRLDHSLLLKLTRSPSRADVYIIADDKGVPVARQTWNTNYNAPKVNGDYPMRLDHVERINAEGNVDRRYDFNSDEILVEVTDYLGDSTTGPRHEYAIGVDGYPTTVKTFDDHYKDDGGKPVGDADHKKMTPKTAWTAYPSLTPPKLPDNVQLYGQRYMFRDR